VTGAVAGAMDKSEDPEERSRMVVAWAKKRGCGAEAPAMKTVYCRDDEYALCDH
jgi:hypothetical protein